MTIADLQSQLLRRPFLPLKMRLADGQSMAVATAHQVAFRPDSRHCIVYEDNERVHLVELGQIESIVTAANAESGQ